MSNDRRRKQFEELRRLLENGSLEFPESKESLPPEKLKIDERPETNHRLQAFRIVPWFPPEDDDVPVVIKLKDAQI